MSLLYRFEDVFSDNDHDIGFSDAIPHRVRMRSKQPIFRKQFPLPWAHREFVAKEVDKLLRQGVIEKSRSFYNSPVFCVVKPHTGGQKLRMVIDYRIINSNAYADYWSMSDVSECLSRVGAAGSNVFSATDLTSGYHQAALHPNSRDPTAFTIEGRSYRFTRIPFGLSGAPATFSRLMSTVCEGLLHSIVYLDDVITHSRGHQQHLRHLENFFTRLRQFNLKLNIKKCVFGASSVEYLGFKISGNGIQAGDEKLLAVKNFPVPSNVRQVRQFCGLANYFRNLIPRFSQLQAPLSKLTRKSSGWQQGPLPAAAKAAFERLRQLLVSAPVVAFPNPKKPFFVSTDASLGDRYNDGGLGAVLTQRDPSGNHRVVAYASRSLKNAEHRYSAFLLEMQAVVFALEQWHCYLYGSKFSVHVDCKPLTHLNTLQRKTLSRLQEFMSRYNFTLTYKSGAQNIVADVLSRNPVAALGTAVSVPQLQAEDTFCQDMLRYLCDGVLPSDRIKSNYILSHSSRCFLSDDKIVLHKPDKTDPLSSGRIVVPPTLRIPLIINNHSDFAAGHLGVAKTVGRLQQSYWWPGMFQDVHRFILSCDVCQRVRNPQSFQQVNAPLRPLPIPPTINHTIHLDLICPKNADGAFRYILIVVDGFSKFMSLFPLQGKDATTVPSCLYDNFLSVHGFPAYIVSDQGREFCNSILDSLCALLKIHKLKTSAYHPASNAACENKIALVNRMLSSLLSSPSDGWAKWLPAISLSYNSSVSESTKCSPFFLTFGVEARLPELPAIEPLPPILDLDPATSRFQRLQQSRTLATACLKRAQDINRKYYDRPHSRSVSFSPGERALLFMPRSTVRMGNPKFAKAWIPVIVLRVISPLSYFIKKAEVRSNRTSVVHVNRLKKFHPVTILSREQLRQIIADSDFPSPAHLASPPDSVCNRTPAREVSQGAADLLPSLSLPVPGRPPSPPLAAAPPRPPVDPPVPEQPLPAAQPNPRPRRGQLGPHLFRGVIRRGRSAGPVEDVPLPNRPLEYKDYPRRQDRVPEDPEDVLSDSDASDNEDP